MQSMVRTAHYQQFVHWLSMLDWLAQSTVFVFTVFSFFFTYIYCDLFSISFNFSSVFGIISGGYLTNTLTYPHELIHSHSSKGEKNKTDVVNESACEIAALSIAVEFLCHFRLAMFAYEYKYVGWFVCLLACY